MLNSPVLKNKNRLTSKGVASLNLIMLIIALFYFINPVLANQNSLMCKQEETNMKDTLVKAAIKAREDAYAPYSHYKVGAALLTKSGLVITGSNIENASYGLSSCAERNAIFKAVTDGMREFTMIAVVTKDGGFSCGACRQVMNEFNPDLLVIIANDKGKILKEMVLSELLPEAFGPSNLLVIKNNFNKS